MSTRPNSSAERRAKARPTPAPGVWLGVDAVAFWLEDAEGYPIWWERRTPDPALIIAARGLENGLDPKTLVLVARTSNGERRVVATGLELQAMSEMFKPVRSPKEKAAIDRMRKARIGPFDMGIDGAAAYWIESTDGGECSPKFERSNPALVAAHEAIVTGANVDALLLVCQLENGDRYEITHGVMLEEFARRAAGLPARPHRITQGPPYPRGTPTE
jgi:hypothetical protein